MKTWLKSTISILLGVMILVTGSGVSLAKMVCVKSGYTAITLNTPDDCCKHEHAHASVTIEEKCCDISSVNIDALQYLVSAAQNIQKSITSFEVPSALSVLDCTQTAKIVSGIVRRCAIASESSYPPIRILTKSFLI